MNEKILLFFKGILMGICDLIPGISGGTIAFITGIYERLINAVKGFSFDTLIKRDFKKLDLGFLFFLLLGIISAILIGSRGIKYLLENYLSYTLMFFMGLILASSFIIFESIKNHKAWNVFFGLIGLIVGLSFGFLNPVNSEPSFAYVFFGGFVAISAMFLPGISGSFILLIMGLYEFIIELLNDVIGNFGYLFVFGIGMLFGAFFISRVISFLFNKDKCKTLYFLLGLVIGALVIPIRRVIESGVDFKEIPILGFLFLIGILVVLGVRSFQVKDLKSV